MGHKIIFTTIHFMAHFANDIYRLSETPCPLYSIIMMNTDVIDCTVHVYVMPQKFHCQISLSGRPTKWEGYLHAMAYN